VTKSRGRGGADPARAGFQYMIMSFLPYCRAAHLPAVVCMHQHAFGMFVITEADAAAIRATFNQEGELSAAIELRRRFPGVTDNTKARPRKDA
jgi:hypothetical protein